MSENITHTAITDDCARLALHSQAICAPFKLCLEKHLEIARLGGVTRSGGKFVVPLLTKYRDLWPKREQGEVLEEKLAFVLGWLCHRAADLQMKPIFRVADPDSTESPTDCSVYHDVYLFREVYGGDQQRREQLLKELAVGQERTGVVRNLVSFGVFVDLGGIDGLIHVSELDWKHVGHPSEVLSVGDEVQVCVLSVDREKERIGLSRKRLLPDPWPVVTEGLLPGDVIEGTVPNVVSLAPYSPATLDIDESVASRAFAAREVEDLFRAFWQRALLGLHTFIPDQEHIERWMERLFRTRQEFYVDIHRYAQAFADPDPDKVQRFILDVNFYDRSDPLIRLARSIQDGHPDKGVEVAKAVEAAASQSQYAQALRRGCLYLQAASDYFERKIDQDALVTALERGQQGVG